MLHFSRERFTDTSQSPLFLTQEDEADLRAMELEDEKEAKRELMEANGEAMDEEDDADDEPDPSQAQVPLSITAPYVFPEPYSLFEVNPTTHCVRFNPTMIPKTMGSIKPGILKGMASLLDLTAGQKKAICAHLCMPMPVESSPIVSLLMATVSEGEAIYWKPQFINYSLSAFQLREIMLAIIHALMPLHHSMSDPKNQHKIQRAFDEYKAQMAFYEDFQEARVSALFHKAAAGLVPGK